MPQASEELRAQFIDDVDAFECIKENFKVERNGLIVQKDPSYKPSTREQAAISYLVLEWDYAY